MPSNLPLSRRLLEGGALATLVTSAYFAVGHRVTATNPVPTSGFEPAVPFVPETVWLYLPGYCALLVAALATLRDPMAFRRALVAFAVVTAVAIALFMAHPVASPSRLDPEGGDATVALLRWLHRNDPSTNAFPSLHVTYVVLSAGMIARCRPRARWFVWALGAAVAVSTLTTRQHWLGDALAGALLGAAGLWWWGFAPQAEASAMRRA